MTTTRLMPAPPRSCALAARTNPDTLRIHFIRVNEGPLPRLTRAGPATIVRAVTEVVVSAPGADAGRETLRNASAVMAQRAVDLVATLAFAVTVPRLLGPEDFGRFALAVSIAHWFASLSGVGSTQVLGRFVPVLLLRDEGADARRLLGHMF